MALNAWLTLLQAAQQIYTRPWLEALKRCGSVDALLAEAPRLLAAPQLAIVGSRSPTADGKETAEQFSRYLAQRGLTITSGLATGIDGASHRGAVAAVGGTIAVLGSGLDVIFPREHARLAAEIA